MKKIAIFTPGRRRYGSIALQLPFVSAIRDYYGDCEITIWTVNNPGEILCFEGGADKIIKYNNMGVLKTIKEINNNKYDAIFNLRRNSSKLHHLVMPFVNTKEKFSHSTHQINSIAYKYHKLIPKKDRYIANAHLELLNSAKETSYQTTIIQNLATVDNKDPHQKALTLLPGGGSGSFKRWPIENFLNVSREVIQNNQLDIIYVILGPQELEYQELLPNTLGEVPLIVCSTPTVKQLITISRKTKLAISNDCGPAHIFQMMQTPIIMLFGKAPEVEKPPQEVLKEWFLFTDTSIPLLPNEQSGHIESIKTEKVAAIANALLQLT